jgi:hypothetical protein
MIMCPWGNNARAPSRIMAMICLAMLAAVEATETWTLLSHSCSERVRKPQMVDSVRY